MSIAVWMVLAATSSAGFIDVSAPAERCVAPAEAVIQQADDHDDVFAASGAALDDAMMRAAVGGTAAAFDITNAGVNVATSTGVVTGVTTTNTTTGGIADNLVNGNRGVTAVFNNTGNGVIFQNTVQVNVFLNGAQ